MVVFMLAMVIRYTPGYPTLFPSEDGQSLCFERFESFRAVLGSKEEIVRCSFKVKAWTTGEWPRRYKEKKITLSPDSRERSAARERASFAARRANGATKMIDGYACKKRYSRNPPFLAISCASCSARSYAEDGGVET